MTLRGHLPVRMCSLLVFVLSGPSLLSLHPSLPLSLSILSSLPCFPGIHWDTKIKISQPSTSVSSASDRTA